MPPQQSRRVKRGRPRRSGKPRILILCEGTRTEPNYFVGFKSSKSLTSVVVRALRPGQVGPTGLLKRVHKELKEDPGWDEVYCVLDHDGRNAKIKALEKGLATIDHMTDSCDIKMILSCPCFEFWLLLHFEITDRPFSAGARGTECEDVIRRLEHHLQGYKKNDSKVFERCREHVDTALENLRKLQHAEPPSSEPSTPHTNVGLLIERLLKLSDM